MSGSLWRFQKTYKKFYWIVQFISDFVSCWHLKWSHHLATDFWRKHNKNCMFFQIVNGTVKDPQLWTTVWDILGDTMECEIKLELAKKLLRNMLWLFCSSTTSQRCPGGFRSSDCRGHWVHWTELISCSNVWFQQKLNLLTFLICMLLFIKLVLRTELLMIG